MATPSSGLLQKLPEGWTPQDAAVLKEYPAPTVGSGEGAIAKARIVIATAGKLVYDSGIYSSGSSDMVIHSDLRFDDSDKSTPAKYPLSNSDAERKALTHIIEATGLWDKKGERIIIGSDTMYVFGSLGPCRCCKEIMKTWAKKNGLTLKFAYTSKEKTVENRTVGGVNGFAEAEQSGGAWICVPSALASKAAEKASQLDLYSQNALKNWRETKNASMLKNLKKGQKKLVLESVTDEEKEILTPLLS